mmetsp:Transcript_5825/g.13443  ORF Transcript_5825/g.13443 Transcript_5825/m.13443 type:complete len:213 (-) Transcript_5825:1965-2603(-)
MLLPTNGRWPLKMLCLPNPVAWDGVSSRRGAEALRRCRTLYLSMRRLRTQSSKISLPMSRGAVDVPHTRTTSASVPRNVVRSCSRSSSRSDQLARSSFRTNRSFSAHLERSRRILTRLTEPRPTTGAMSSCPIKVENTSPVTPPRQVRLIRTKSTTRAAASTISGSRAANCSLEKNSFRRASSSALACFCSRSFSAVNTSLNVRRKKSPTTL